MKKKLGREVEPLKLSNFFLLIFLNLTIHFFVISNPLNSNAKIGCSNPNFHWLVGSGEPCFQGRPIHDFMNLYAFTLLSHCRVMSQDPSSRSRYLLEGDSIQILPAVSQSARTLPLSYRGRAS